MNNKKLQSILIIVTIVFILSLTVLASVFVSNEMKKNNFIGLDKTRTISVSGEGKITTKPDMAEVIFSVISTDDDTEIALDKNNKKAEKLIEYLKEQKIEKQNIQTTSFNIRPVYQTNQETKERKLDYYEVTNRVTVEIKDLDKVGNIVDGIVKKGANKINNLQFLISNQEEIKNQAREKAVLQAEQKAKQISSTLGVKIGRIIDFSEQKDYYFPVEVEQDLKSVKQVPFEPGEQDVTINVQIRYEIK